jgi:hypothetical protein
LQKLITHGSQKLGILPIEHRLLRTAMSRYWITGSILAHRRVRQIDPCVARWYHGMTRCARRAFLLEEGTTDRK